MPLRIAMVAGEYSGDILGGDLIRVLRQYNPDIEIYGIAGPQMTAAGCKALYTTEHLAVMGIIEPIKHLPRILHIRHQLRKYILKNPPDVFVGIDSPDFNLGLEVTLKKAGIPVIHYVSPSVWAWRKNRIHQIKKAVDLMLTLFPFETTVYHQHAIPVQFIGHPLADRIPIEPNKQNARKHLGLPESSKILALLPGSRHMEIKNLGKIFIETAKWCLEQEPHLQIVVAMVNKIRSNQLMKIIRKTNIDFPINVIIGDSLRVIEAADVTLLASGTASLEALLLKCPMVVAYRLSPLTFFIAKRLVKLKYFSLPNLLADQRLVPEFLQDNVTPSVLGEAVLQQLRDTQRRTELIQAFTNIHHHLKKAATDQAAEAILKLVARSKKT